MQGPFVTRNGENLINPFVTELTAENPIDFEDTGPGCAQRPGRIRPQPRCVPGALRQSARQSPQHDSRRHRWRVPADPVQHQWPHLVLRRQPAVPQRQR